MDDGYEQHSLPTGWSRLYSPTQQHSAHQIYAASGHHAYQQNSPTSMPLASSAPSAFANTSGYGAPTLTNSFPPPPPQSYVPGPPVSSGPTFPHPTSAMGNAYALAPASARTQPELQSGMYGAVPVTSSYGQPLQYQQRPANQEPEPVHVVGQQGRRGVLPSAPGRPPASHGKSAGTLVRDDETGKYHCQHCVKSYQHAKHLKRHMLRHTGDRPYQCVLCQDNFSRSDILKRHFQKCSQRRGNPHGATHLSGSQAHLRKNAAAKSMEDALVTPTTPTLPPDSAFSSTSWNNFGGYSDQSYAGSLPALSNRPSRSNSSICNPTEAQNESRRSLSSLEHVPGVKLEFNGHRDPGFPATAINDLDHGLASYSINSGQHPVTMSPGFASFVGHANIRPDATNRDYDVKPLIHN